MFKMICFIMFSIVDSLMLNISGWCNNRYTLITKCWFLAFLILSVYALVLLVAKASPWIRSHFENSAFKELYGAVKNNDTIKSIIILDRYPKYVNKFQYPEGYTPFMVACANANTQLVKYMLSKGAQVRLKSKSNETPFYLAAFYYIQNKDCKNATCIRELYHAGADINEPGKHNMTIVQVAAIFGHTSLLKWLLTKNADLKLCPHPYLLAKSQGHQEAASLIEGSLKIKSILYK